MKRHRFQTSQACREQHVTACVLADGARIRPDGGLPFPPLWDGCQCVAVRESCKPFIEICRAARPCSFHHFCGRAARWIYRPVASGLGRNYLQVRYVCDQHLNTRLRSKGTTPANKKGMACYEGNPSRSI